MPQVTPQRNKIMEILKIALAICKDNRGFFSGGFGGMLSFAGDILGGYLGRDSARDAQKEANELTRELYYADREWNKPINQVQRLREAGLNPALMYGGGGSVAGNTSKGAPRMESIGGYDIDFASAMASLASYLNAEKTAKETENAVKDGKLLDEKITSQKIQNRIGEHDATIIENSPVVSTDRGTVPMVARTLSGVVKTINNKTEKGDFKKGAVNVLNKPLTDTQKNANVSNRSTPWFMKYSGRPWFMKY